jgi:hypothetical protein
MYVVGQTPHIVGRKARHEVRYRPRTDLISVRSLVAHACPLSIRGLVTAFRVSSRGFSGI